MGRILVVDDNAFILKIQTAIIEKAGATVEQANSGARALELIKSNNFDCVFMDMQMPEKDGVQTTKEIRAFNHLIPIFAVTGNEDDDDIQSCFDAGMNGVLQKPLNTDKVIEAIRTI